MKLSASSKIRIALWIIFLVGGALLSLNFDVKYFPNLLKNPIFHLISFVFGIFVLKLSFHAAAVGGRELKRKGRRGDLPRLETNVLVTSGIYKCTRHPMLFGLIFLPFGLSLILGFPTFIFFIAPIEGIIILILVLTLEEKEALDKFGNKYLEYKKNTPFIPKSKECYKKLFLD